MPGIYGTSLNCEGLNCEVHSFDLTTVKDSGLITDVEKNILRDLLAENLQEFVSEQPGASEKIIRETLPSDVSGVMFESIYPSTSNTFAIMSKFTIEDELTTDGELAYDNSNVDVVTLESDERRITNLVSLGKNTAPLYVSHVKMTFTEGDNEYTSSVGGHDLDIVDVADRNLFKALNSKHSNTGANPKNGIKGGFNNSFNMSHALYTERAVTRTENNGLDVSNQYVSKVSDHLNRTEIENAEPFYGSMKIVQPEFDVLVGNVNTNVDDSSTLSKADGNGTTGKLPLRYTEASFNELFDDETRENVGNGYKLQIELQQGGGYDVSGVALNTVNDVVLLSVDDRTLAENLKYMEEVAKLSHEVEIQNGDLVIQSNDNSDMFEVLDGFEFLDQQSDISRNGSIVVADTNNTLGNANARYAKVQGGADSIKRLVVNYESSENDHKSDVGVLSEEMKVNHTVNADVKCVLKSTETGIWSSAADVASNNNSVLVFEETPNAVSFDKSDVSEFSSNLSSALSLGDSEFALFKVRNKMVLSQENGIYKSGLGVVTFNRVVNSGNNPVPPVGKLIAIDAGLSSTVTLENVDLKQMGIKDLRLGFTPTNVREFLPIEGFVQDPATGQLIGERGAPLWRTGTVSSIGGNYLTPNRVVPIVVPPLEANGRLVNANDGYLLHVPETENTADNLLSFMIDSKDFKDDLRDDIVIKLRMRLSADDTTTSDQLPIKVDLTALWDQPENGPKDPNNAASTTLSNTNITVQTKLFPHRRLFSSGIVPRQVMFEYTLESVHQFNNGNIIASLTQKNIHNITVKMPLASYDNLFVTFPDVVDIRTIYIRYLNNNDFNKAKEYYNNLRLQANRRTIDVTELVADGYTNTRRFDGGHLYAETRLHKADLYGFNVRAWYQSNEVPDESAEWNLLDLSGLAVADFHNGTNASDIYFKRSQDEKFKGPMKLEINARSANRVLGLTDDLKKGVMNMDDGDLTFNFNQGPKGPQQPVNGLAVKVESGRASVGKIVNAAVGKTSDSEPYQLPPGWSQQLLKDSFEAGTNNAAAPSQYALVTGPNWGPGSDEDNKPIGFTSHLHLDAEYEPALGDEVVMIFTLFNVNGSLNTQGKVTYTYEMVMDQIEMDEQPVWKQVVSYNNQSGSFPWSQADSGSLAELNAAVYPDPYENKSNFDMYYLGMTLAEGETSIDVEGYKYTASDAQYIPESWSPYNVDELFLRNGSGDFVGTRYDNNNMSWNVSHINVNQNNLNVPNNLLISVKKNNNSQLFSFKLLEYMLENFNVIHCNKPVMRSEITIKNNGVNVKNETSFLPSSNDNTVFYSKLAEGVRVEIKKDIQRHESASFSLRGDRVRILPHPSYSSGRYSSVQEINEEDGSGLPKATEYNVVRNVRPLQFRGYKNNKGDIVLARTDTRAVMHFGNSHRDAERSVWKGKVSTVANIVNTQDMMAPLVGSINLKFTTAFSMLPLSVASSPYRVPVNVYFAEYTKKIGTVPGIRSDTSESTVSEDVSGNVSDVLIHGYVPFDIVATRVRVYEDESYSLRYMVPDLEVYTSTEYVANAETDDNMGWTLYKNLSDHDLADHGFNLGVWNFKRDVTHVDSHTAYATLPRPSFYLEAFSINDTPQTLPSNLNSLSRKRWFADVDLEVNEHRPFEGVDGLVNVKVELNFQKEIELRKNNQLDFSFDLSTNNLQIDICVGLSGDGHQNCTEHFNGYVSELGSPSKWKTDSENTQPNKLWNLRFKQLLGPLRSLLESGNENLIGRNIHVNGIPPYGLGEYKLDLRLSESVQMYYYGFNLIQDTEGNGNNSVKVVFNRYSTAASLDENNWAKVFLDVPVGVNPFLSKLETFEVSINNPAGLTDNPAELTDKIRALTLEDKDLQWTLDPSFGLRLVGRVVTPSGDEMVVTDPGRWEPVEQPFSSPVRMVALTKDGYDMLHKLLHVSPENPLKVIRAVRPDIMRVKSLDGNPVFRITADGQIMAPLLDVYGIYLHAATWGQYSPNGKVKQALEFFYGNVNSMQSTF